MAALERRVAAHIVVPFDQLGRVLVSAHAHRILSVAAEIAVDRAAVDANKRIIVSNQAILQGRYNLMPTTVCVPMLLLLCLRNPAVTLPQVAHMHRCVDGVLLCRRGGLKGFIKVDLVERDLRRLLLAASVHYDLLILNLLYLGGHMLHRPCHLVTCPPSMPLALDSQAGVGKLLLLQELLLHELGCGQVLMVWVLVVGGLASKELVLTLYFLIDFPLLRRRTLRFCELDLIALHLCDFYVLRLRLLQLT